MYLKLPIYIVCFIKNQSSKLGALEKALSSSRNTLYYVVISVTSQSYQNFKSLEKAKKLIKFILNIVVFVLLYIVKSVTMALVIRQLQRSYATNLKKHQADLMARSLPKREALPGVENIIVVASGKGGVGKSTVAGTELEQHMLFI